jgi:hypothetical protein
VPMIVAFVLVPIVAFKSVAVFEAAIHRLGRVRLGVVFDCVGRAQHFAFQARSAPNKLQDLSKNFLFRSAYFHSGPQTATGASEYCRGCRSGQNRLNAAREMPHLMVRGFAVRVKPPGPLFAGEEPGREPSAGSSASSIDSSSSHGRVIQAMAKPRSVRETVGGSGPGAVRRAALDGAGDLHSRRLPDCGRECFS